MTSAALVVVLTIALVVAAAGWARSWARQRRTSSLLRSAVELARASEQEAVAAAWRRAYSRVEAEDEAAKREVDSAASGDLADFLRALNRGP